MTMIIPFWWNVAIVCNLTAYLFYWLAIKRQLVRPNRSSWLIWSAATAIEALTYQAINHEAAQNTIFVVSALACIVVTIAVWRQSTWQRPSTTESVCMGLSLAALVIWVGFQSAYWAHMLIVAAVPISFVPTWLSAMEDRRRERSPAWGLWTIGDLATLFVTLATLRDEGTEVPYIFVEFLCHASMWFMIGLLSINPLRSFGFARGKFFIREEDRGQPRIFSIGENHLGKAVYAAVPFVKGSVIVEFKGPRLHKSFLPVLMAGPKDRFVQIDAVHYMGPSGGVDDLINHSCDPNSGLRFANDGVFLEAIRDIAVGEEINWDYSTTLYESGWSMECHCRSERCRGTVRDFLDLDDELRQYYRRLNLVPAYLLEDPAMPLRAGRPLSPVRPAA